MHGYLESPSRIPTAEELEKKISDLANAVRENITRPNAEAYNPTFDALRKNGPSTIQQISETTGRPISKERKYLRMLSGYDWPVKRVGHTYTLVDETFSIRV